MKTNTKTTAAKAEQSEKVNQKKLDKEVNELYLDQRRRAQARALWHMYRRGELQLQQLRIPTGLGYHEQIFLYSHPSNFAKNEKD